VILDQEREQKMLCTVLVNSYTVNSRYNEYKYRYNESHRSPQPKSRAYKELIRIFVTTKFPL
jgi:hypothetical protein